MSEETKEKTTEIPESVKIAASFMQRATMIKIRLLGTSSEKIDNALDEYAKLPEKQREIIQLIIVDSFSNIVMNDSLGEKEDEQPKEDKKDE